MRRAAGKTRGRLDGLFQQVTVLAILGILLWILFWNSGEGFAHFAYWDFWCAPIRGGPSVAGLFGAVFILAATWLIATAMTTPYPKFARVAGETVVLVFLAVTLHALDHWLGSPYCRIAAEPYAARGALSGLNRRWIPPEGYRAVRCLPVDGQHHCWRRMNLAPYAPSTAFPMIPPARTVAERRAACSDAIRLAYRPHDVWVATTPVRDAPSKIVAGCMKKLRLRTLTPDILMFRAHIAWPTPDPYPEGWIRLRDIGPAATYVCRFSRDGHILSAARLTSCDQLADEDEE